ncbi:MAG TPA: hypothetical protein VH083_02250 [Myxococcales bacterium]|nr:hypothetical protein [Myxococcales bacterium]
MRVFVLLSLLAAGCGHLLPGGNRCPASGGPQWRELRSQHFALDTDLPEADAALWVKDLEQLEATVTGALSNRKVDLPGRLRVVVPASLDTFAAVAPSLYALGYFTANSFFHEPTIVLHPGARTGDPEVIAHELGHFISFHLFPRHPDWFEEGLVQFAQTVANPNPQYHNLAGLMPNLRIHDMQHGAADERVSLQQLFGWKDQQMGLLELWSWGLFHWLWNNKPEQLDDYQRRLLDKTPPDKAWALAFPEFDPAKKGAAEKLEALIDAHLREAKFDSYYEVKATSNAAYTARLLSAAQVHVLLLDVKVSWVRRGARSLGFEDDKKNTITEQLNFALQDDPNDPVALVRLKKMRNEPLLPAARTAAAAHPDDWRAQSILGTLETPGGPEQEAALRKAVQLNPDNAYTQNRLAAALQARPQEAMPFARRAVQLTPDDPYNLETLMALDAAVKSCAEARELYDRASDLKAKGSDELDALLQKDLLQCPK